MSSNLELLSAQYLSLVENHVETWPGYKRLCQFLSVKQEQYQPVKIAQISITADKSSTEGDLGINFKEQSFYDLEEELLSSPYPKHCCRLFVIENICPRIMALIGGTFDIDPQFFADHLNNNSWYQIANVGDRLTALPSIQKLQDFIQLRFIDIRTIINNPSSSSFSNSAEKWVDVALDSSSDAKDFIFPDETTTRILRKAGKVIPRHRKGNDFGPLLCVRQVVSMCFQERRTGDEGWTGVILIDPPFRMPLENSNIALKPSEYRSFRSRPSLRTSPTKITDNRESTYETLIACIKAQCEDNQNLLAEVKSEPFLLISDVYRLVASNWIVVNEYINRELSTVEYILEKEEPSFQNLEIYLKGIYVYRRRCTRYHELISEAKNQCHRRGQKCWPHHNTSDLAIQNGKDLEEDFIHLQAKTMETLQRIQKNIKLLTALVAIGEGKQGLEENHGIVRLSLLATVFLPFSTVASILGIQGNYAPGADRFWLFWAVAIPLTALIVALFLPYEGFRKSVYHGLQRAWNSCIRRRRRIVHEE